MKRTLAATQTANPNRISSSIALAPRRLSALGFALCFGSWSSVALAQEAGEPPPPAAAADAPPPAAAQENLATVAEGASGAETRDAVGTLPPAGSDGVPVTPEASGTPQTPAAASTTEPPPVAENQSAAVAPGVALPRLSKPPTGELAAADPGGSDSSDEPRQFGARLDVGVPELAVVSFVYRPFDMLRGNIGVGYNGVSPSVRIGADFLPLGWGPALSVSYGHAFEGDANGLIRSLMGTEENTELLKRFGYDYVNFRLGMEVGGDRFIFFARGGTSYLRADIHNFDEVLEAESSQTSNGNTEIRVPQDPVLSAWLASVDLGFIVRF